LKMANLCCLHESPLFVLKCDHKTETFAALLGALIALNDGECGMAQTLLEPARQDWGRAILEVATDPRDRRRSAFADVPDLPRRAKDKVSRPLYAVSLIWKGVSNRESPCWVRKTSHSSGGPRWNWAVGGAGGSCDDGLST